MGSFESFLKNMAMTLGGGGGGEEPKSKKATYTSQEQITNDNNFLRNFLTRHSAPQFLAANSVVARNVGDPIPQYEYPNGRPPIVDKPNLQTTLPMGVSVDDVFQTKEGTYGFMHPQNGNFVLVDPASIYSKYKKDSSKK